MSAVGTAAPWAGGEVDPDRVVAEFARRFPGVSVWAGEFTGAWWAMTRDRFGRDRLVEAATPGALGHRLQELAPRRAFAPRYSRTGLGSPAVGGAMPSRPMPELRTHRSSCPVVPSVAVPKNPSRGGWLRRLLVRALDGEAAARERAQHELIASSPYWWDEDLDARPPWVRAVVIPLPRRAGR